MAIPTNGSNFNSKNNSSPMIKNNQHTHEALPSISSNAAWNEDEVGSRLLRNNKATLKLKMIAKLLKIN